MTSNLQFLTFELNSQVYGVPIGVVREINRITETTVVPQTPPYILGVTNLRGKVIPIIKLRLKLSLSNADNTKDTCVIVIESHQGLIGAVVDRVLSVVEFAKDQIEPAPAMVGTGENYLLGMGKLDQQVVILMDPLKLFEHDGIVRGLSKESISGAA